MTQICISILLISKKRISEPFVGLKPIDPDIILTNGIDGSVRKPALIQDTDYLVEKTYNSPAYVGPFGAFLMP